LFCQRLKLLGLVAISQSRITFDSVVVFAQKVSHAHERVFSLLALAFVEHGYADVRQGNFEVYAFGQFGSPLQLFGSGLSFGFFFSFLTFSLLVFGLPEFEFGFGLHE